MKPGAGMAKAPLISIVDDDESAREGLSDLVEAMGFAVKSFMRAQDFLQSKSLRNTACLITDIRMPEMGGQQLHNLLVASKRVIPTIMITAFPTERERAQALQAGVVCYLAKPVAESDLLACLTSALERHNAAERGS